MATNTSHHQKPRETDSRKFQLGHLRCVVRSKCLPNTDTNAEEEYDFNFGRSFFSQCKKLRNFPLSFVSDWQSLKERDFFFPVDYPFDESSSERIKKVWFAVVRSRCGFIMVRIRHIGYPFLHRSHTTFSRATRYYY